MMKCFIVLGKKGKSVYLWYYTENEFYEYMPIDNLNFDYSINDVLKLDINKYEISRKSSVIRFYPKDAQIIGKTNFGLFLNKVDIILGNPNISFEKLFEQREERRRIISLVKFSGSQIINRQLRIKHEKNYSYCDILDNDLKNKEGFEYKGLALIEYIPEKRKERNFNLIFSIKSVLTIKKNIETINKNDSENNIDIIDEEYVTIMKEEREKMGKEMDKKIENSFILQSYGNESNKEFYEEYFDEDILEDIVNEGFNDFNMDNDIKEYDYEDEIDQYDQHEGYYEYLELEDISSNKSLEKILGCFRIYKENDVNKDSFATNNSYVSINLLNPYNPKYSAETLNQIENMDIEVLFKYDKKVDRLTKNYKDLVSSISTINSPF